MNTGKTIKCMMIYSVLILICLAGASCSDGGGFPLIPPLTERFVVDSSGGYYTFENGISITVPPDAVTVRTSITLTRLGTSVEDGLFGDNWTTGPRNMLFTIEAGPDGQVFALPVQVRVPDTGVLPGDWVVVYLVDPDSGSITMADIDFTVDPSDGSITLSLDHFSAYSAEVMSELNATTCVSDPGNCRCGAIHVDQRDKSLLCTEGDCQHAESNLTVTYLSCGGNPQDTAFFSEYTGSCVPSINVSAADAGIPACSATEVTASIKIGCDNLSGNTVDLVSGSLGVIDPTFGTTGAGGSFSSTFTAGKRPGTETVTGNATVSFYRYRISASTFEGAKEATRGPLSTKSVSGSAQIAIEPDDMNNYPKAIYSVWYNDSSNYIVVSIDFQNSDPYFLYDMDPDSTNAACSLTPYDPVYPPRLQYYYRVGWLGYYPTLIDKGIQNTTHTLTVSTGAMTSSGYPLLAPVVVTFVPADIVSGGPIYGP